MFAFYSTSDGQIQSVVSASSEPQAPAGFAYISYSHDKDDIHKYEVVNGVLQQKSQSDIDDIEIPMLQRKLRRKRDQMLTSTDWTQSPDSPLSDTKKQEWATYRQQLRDLPSNTTDFRNPTFPARPT